ncbi:MAG: CRISPR-associated helicase Cas3' [Thermaerobacter sp.]|nr:CRISPR-associated helicase Cas3' [Thermaerobacter sp.]
MQIGGQALLFDLWAKTDPWHPLPCHLVDVGNVALALLQGGAFEGTAKRFEAATGCPSEGTAAWLGYLCALHDLGKCHSEFQAKGGAELVRPLQAAGLGCAQTLRKFRHEAVSAAWVMGHLVDTLGWTRAAAATASLAILGHHGNFSAAAPEESAVQVGRWEPLRAELERAVRATFRPPFWDAPDFKDHSAAGVLLSGLIVLSDWIASNPQLLSPLWQGEPMVEYAETSRRQAQEAVRRLGLDKARMPTSSTDFQKVWPNIRTLRPVQTAVQQLAADGLAPGLTIIEAPMGEGKTEAAIYLASQWIAAGHASGMYVALPTAATSNQMFGRVREFLEGHDAAAAEGVQLVHGASWLLDRATPDLAPALNDEEDMEAGERALDWFRPRKRSLLGAFGVGTVDQAEMSVLNVKHGFLRLYGLAQKVLVVDEVHAYDAYQTEIVSRLLGWCRALSIPVILLSATLPQRRKETLMRAYGGAADPPSEATAYPLITHVEREGKVTLVPVSGSYQQRDLQLSLHPGLLEDFAGTAQLVAQRVLAVGGCHVVIANTVNAAQEIYRHLAQELAAADQGTVELRLFHARFPAGIRQDIEQEVLTLFDKRSSLAAGNPQGTLRPTRAVLVATQVVEQSLDLDFDEMYTQIAPIDLLLQRSGRLHRHDRLERPTGPRPTLHVLLPAEGSMDFGPTGSVYHRYILMRTFWRLGQSREWRLPGEMRALVEGVYGDPPQDFVETPDIASLREDWWVHERGEEATARRYLIPEPYHSGFKLARMAGGVFAEDDGKVRTYFTARTRIGDESVRVAVLEGSEDLEILVQRRTPPKSALERILLRTVSLPAWWLKGASPGEGFAPLEEGPIWLHGTRILRLQDGKWRGDVRGQPCVIELDPVYGLMLREEGM